MLIALSEEGLAHFRVLFHDKSSAETLEEKNNIPLKKRYRCILEPIGKAQNTLARIQTQLPYVINSSVLANVP